MILKFLNRYKIYLQTILVIFMGLIPIFWFLDKGGTIINGIDTNFPLDPWLWFRRRFFVWDGINNAGVDSSSSSAGMFFHLIQLIPYLIGFNLQGVQIVSLVFWFLLIVFSAYLLARSIFPNKFLSQIIFVVFYVFNIYLFNTWENVKVANLSLVAAIPLGIWLLVQLREKKLNLRQVPLYACLVGIVASGTGINPSYLISFFFTLFLFSLALGVVDLKNRGALLRVRDFLLISFFILLVNSFWFFPALNFIFKNISPTESIQEIGFSNWIDSLSENTSFFNILRLQGAWDWYAIEETTGLPLYIPYALNYFYNLPFIIFSLVIPSLAILSLFIRRKEKDHFYLAFVLMLVIGVFLGAGTHPPSGVIFAWLLEHLPFFSLFRSPWYIFTPLVFLAYAGLIGLLFESLDRKLKGMKKPFLNFLLILTGLVLLVGNFLYSYPLITGKIFRPTRPDGFYINFPPYVFQAKEWLSTQNQGRVVGYPDDEIEQFNWKFRGIESILKLLVDNETIYAPLNATQSPLAKMIKSFYLNLKRGELEAAQVLAARLNINLIFEKKDQNSLAPRLSPEMNQFLVQQIQAWSFYQLPEQKGSAKIYSPDDITLSDFYFEGEKILGVVSPGKIFLNPGDTMVQKIPRALDLAGYAVLAKNSQIEMIRAFNESPFDLSIFLSDPSASFSEAVFKFNSPRDDSYQPILERYQIEKFSLPTEEKLKVEVDGQTEEWTIEKITDSYLFFGQRKFSKGEHTLSFNLDNQNMIPNGNFEETIDFERKVNGEFRILEEENNHFLSIQNKSEKDISADFLVPNFDYFGQYLISFKYRRIFGQKPIVLAGQSNVRALLKTEMKRLPDYPEWTSFSFLYDPVQSPSEMKILLAAPFADDPLGTKVFYDDLALYRLFTNNLILISGSQTQFLSTPEISFQKHSPVLYTGQASKALGPHLLVFAENYSPEWQLTLTDLTGQELSTIPVHFSANLYANAWYLENTPEEYQFRLYYRPQNLFYLGSIVSGLSFLFGIVLFLPLSASSLRKRNKRGKEK